MDEIRIIRHMWSLIFDMLLYIRGQSSKTPDEFEKQIDLLEYECRPYADLYEDQEVTFLEK